MTTYTRPAIFVVAFLIFGSLIWFSLAAYSAVPLVDGWPVYHRLMRYILGEIDLKTYLLAPHGSHPHSIVYALYRIDLHYGGRQLIPHLASIASIVAMACAMAYWVRSAISERGDSILADIGAAAALVVIPTLSIEVLAPFQVVLTASRFVFCAFIIWFVHVLRREQAFLDVILLVVSCILITFHGSGLLFGFVVLAQHLLLGRTWFQRISGAAPLVASILYSRLWLPPGSSEMAGVLKWLATFQPSEIINLAISTFSYYTVPLVPIWPHPDDRWGLIVFGALLAIATMVWAAVTVVRFRSHGTPTLGLAFITLFVALSAASSALVWESRSVLGFTGEPEVNIMHSARYAAGALLAYALAIVPLLTLPRRWIKGGKSAVALIVVLLLASNVWTIRQRGELTDNLDRAASSLFAGAEITDATAQSVWPGVSQDWYWPKELVRLVDFMNERRIGYAYGLPALGSHASALWKTTIETPVVQATSVSGICLIAGVIPPLDRDVISSPHFLAVADGSGTVIGAVAVPVETDPTRVSGYVRCQGGPASVKLPEVFATGDAVN